MKGLKVLAVCLHGSNTPDGRDTSYKAFDELRGMYSTFGIGLPVITYVDKYGYPVFCFSAIIEPHYVPDQVLSIWETLCTSYGIESGSIGTSYEILLDFDSVIHGDYEKKDLST